MLLAWILTGMVPHAFADELFIAAASDLNFAFTELAGEFERTTGHHVKLSFGSSGNFYAQIHNGAPFDLYFSADIAYPRMLEEAGLVVPGSLYGYAIGQIVLWINKRSPWDPSKGLEILRDPAIRKIAIANPRHAPYGKAAVTAMEFYKVYEHVKEKLILGENISHAAQFLESGACDAGIIALSLARAPRMQEAGRYWEIPDLAHPPLEQGAVIMKQTKHLEAAKEFLAFIKSFRGQVTLRRYGFTVPG